MAVVIIPNLASTPLIDVVSVTDYLLIGDESDGGEVKRVLVGSLPSPDSTDKLAIADYSFNTIPDKPITFPPDLHTHADKLAIADYGWETIPNKPLEFPPTVHAHSISEISGLQATLSTLATIDYSQIKQSIKPVTRSNGSPLQVGDYWFDGNGFKGFFNGTYWLSAAFKAWSSIETISSTNPNAGTVIVPAIQANQRFFLHKATVVYHQPAGLWDESNYYVLGVKDKNIYGAAGDILSSKTINTYSSAQSSYHEFTSLNAASTSWLVVVGYCLPVTKVGAPPSMSAYLSLEVSHIL